MKDIEDLRIIYGSDHLYLSNHYYNLYHSFPNIEKLLDELIEHVIFNQDITSKNLFKYLKSLNLKYKIKPKNSIYIYLLKKRIASKQLDIDIYEKIIELMKTKTCRSLSGILEVAVMTSPGKFSCAENCYYCPDQKDMPRSYIKEEPAVRRAAENGFDPVKQIHTRLTSYSCNGHDIDKIEYIILGGTWSNYPVEYQEEFMRDLYYAVNIWFDSKPYRERLTLSEEKKINETTLVKVIGLTIETRPDYITKEEIMRYINYGVTRVQLGVQTINDKLLKKINRGCYTKDTINALDMLMNYGFKILIHIMPNLPDSTPDIDKKTFYELVFNPDLQADEWKIYPTSVTTTSDKDNEPVNTVIEKWYNEGKYVPYSYSELMDVLIYAKCIVPNYIRISRIFRDIPLPNITGGADKPNLRQILQEEMKELGYKCNCIRCREIKQTKFDIDDIEYDYLSYDTKNNINYFISANYNTKLVGFLRLSIKKKKIKTLDVLDDASVVRELHIYGKMKAIYLSNNSNSQNRGIGTKLLNIAEVITMSHNLSKITVISGVGVRNFYKKNGYYLEENYMTKRLVNYYNYYIVLLWFILVSLGVYICFI